MKINLFRSYLVGRYHSSTKFHLASVLRTKFSAADTKPKVYAFIVDGSAVINTHSLRTSKCFMNMHPNVRNIYGYLQAVRKPRLVIAIDFGTYASGFALQWRSDFETNKLDIYCEQWDGGSFLTYKTLTCILLNQDKEVKEFGFDAEERYCELTTGDGSENQQDWYLFRHFKMTLYNISEVNEQTLIEDVNGTPLPMIDVFGAAIEFMKGEAISSLKSSGLKYFEEQTKWVITVPAIWDETAKQLMRSCAEKAGIKGKYLSIALEPECAGLYCKEIPRDQLTVIVEGDTTKYISEPVEGDTSKYIGEPGSTFMVVDMGGGTVDITTLKVNEDNSMKQIYRSIGGPRAGQSVDDKFYKMIEEGIGRQSWIYFTQNYRRAELEFRRDFELQKRNVKHPLSKTRRRRKVDTFKVRIPNQLMQFLEKSKDNKIVKLLNEGCENFKIEMSTFIFPIETIRSIFEETVEEMGRHVAEVVDSTRESGVTLDAMVVVGGFASSNYIIEAFREKFCEYNIPVVRPQSTELAVLRGAVLFGHNEEIITARVVRFTYGVGMLMKFDAKRNNPGKKFADEDGVEWATDVFRKHVTINDEVETGVWIADKDYFPVDKNQTNATVYVYSSTEDDPDHTTDEGCKYVGSFEIRFPENKAEIEIAMYFSGTEIVIRAKEKKSGNVSYQTLKSV